MDEGVGIATGQTASLFGISNPRGCRPHPPPSTHIHMLRLNLCENLNLSCFFRSSRKTTTGGAPRSSSWVSCFRGCCSVATQQMNDDFDDHNIMNVSRQYRISILPVKNDFDIDNLYPLTDHVELWNTFVVGNDKTYILASVNDPHICIPRGDDLPNQRGENVLPNELVMFFDGLWTKTLLGKQLQFYMVWNDKLYLLNTYPFFNGGRSVIGAILFMRAFETMPESRPSIDEGAIISPPPR